MYHEITFFFLNILGIGWIFNVFVSSYIKLFQIFNQLQYYETFCPWKGMQYLFLIANLMPGG